MSASINDHDQSINCDEIEELIAKEDEINTESQITIKPLDTSLSCVRQVQDISLSLGKSSVTNIEENLENQSNNKTKKSILSSKTSNIPGPVGLLPILVRLNFVY